ncbi:GNAT family N-acetyltransferase [Paenibacillus swuensis]|uniref:GNAT family N-acetyltransferase n=1 Tax=Paenibacillus swuensis TaxID=1178515 RepID=UPI000B2ECAB9|nr:GNAT family N-acetyltransferase [Paenibacillus swuensis]
MHQIKPMKIEDYEQSLNLWKRTEGMGLSEADSRESIQSYLARNPGMSFVSIAHEQVIGSILCGHDGRRGYIYHVAVDPEYRGLSIGKALVDSSLEQLRNAGIMKCHLMVVEANEIGKSFWGA